MSPLLRTLLLSAVCLLGVLPAHGQIAVDLKIKRRSFMRYEPLLATVSISNLSGRDLHLQDAENQWFGFQINTGASESLLPPINPDYHLDPLELKAGETVKRTVNLNTLFTLSEYGRYRIKATIFSSELNKFFASTNETIEINEGVVVWKQTVGVPGAADGPGESRTITMLNYQVGLKQHLYARIEDPTSGAVYCTYQLSSVIEGQAPQIQLDSSNNVYVLQLLGPKEYLLSKIGVNGQFGGQTRYSSQKARPFLRRMADGQLQLVNAHRIAVEKPGTVVPKISDRPIGMPLAK